MWQVHLLVSVRFLSFTLRWQLLDTESQLNTGYCSALLQDVHWFHNIFGGRCTYSSVVKLPQHCFLRLESLLVTIRHWPPTLLGKMINCLWCDFMNENDANHLRHSCSWKKASECGSKGTLNVVVGARRVCRSECFTADRPGCSEHQNYR